MATLIDYAELAGRAYQSTRSSINWFPITENWVEFFHVPNNPDYPQFTGVDGFEAVAFQNKTGFRILRWTDGISGLKLP